MALQNCKQIPSETAVETQSDMTEQLSLRVGIKNAYWINKWMNDNSAKFKFLNYHLVNYYK